ncbi:hypothetical protein AXF42_Ash016435 [Apostasia shenzhenica]|uniref:Peptidase A2 domain-containing protein n=1 Tax=Apostasia shenzhenica TaxID=1088818 RepID=A0A2I0A046_9ASPA|nr:hypothetical protein AXF42_Ash016435 [Apostasia shenzhenica]
MLQILGIYLLSTPLLEWIVLTAADASVVKKQTGSDVYRTLVDTGSSVDILYLRAFKEMGFGPGTPLTPSMTVFSFSGDVYRPAGYALLRVALEDGLRRERKQVNFILINAPSGYNAILERPSMAAFRMVPSTFHLCIKFSTPFGIATIRGDRAEARKIF